MTNDLRHTGVSDDILAPLVRGFMISDLRHTGVSDGSTDTTGERIS